jgi:hypothetical protein
MQFLRVSLLLAVALTCGGCFQMTTVMKLNGDGSGTIEHRMLFTTQALAQIRQFGALGGRQIDPTSEQQAREMAATLGPGVSYVSSTPVSTAVGQGRDAVYAFTDVNQLRVAAQPPTPGGTSIGVQGLGADGGTLTFSFTREASGNAVLHINVPEPAFADALNSNPGIRQQLPMMKAMLARAHMTLAVEPSGTLVRTNSPYVEGSRVTLLDIDLDQVLQDADALVAKVQAATTPEETKAALADVPGLKITLERDIVIEFTPAK